MLLVGQLFLPVFQLFLPALLQAPHVEVPPFFRHPQPRKHWLLASHGPGVLCTRNGSVVLIQNVHLVQSFQGGFSQNVRFPDFQFAEVHFAMLQHYPRPLSNPRTLRPGSDLSFHQVSEGGPHHKTLSTEGGPHS